MCIDEGYFSNIFAKTFNTSPIQYVINRKLGEATKLLLEGELSVKEIAYSLGFDSPAYFSRLYKNKTNIAPSQIATINK